MALTTYGTNNALAGATAKMGFVNLFSSATWAATSATVVGSSVLNVTGAKAKGFTNGAIVMIKTLTGGVTGLLALRPYYVVGEATNSFELALEEGGTGVKVAGAELTTATEFDVLTELSGGSNVRVATSWNTAKLAETTDTLSGTIKVPAGKTVTYAGWWEKSTGGTGKEGLQAAVKLSVAEPYGAEGVYEVTSDKLERSPLAA